MPEDQTSVDLSAMEKKTNHFVLIPLMAQGHMIPMVDFGNLLAARGMLTSIITTPVNATRFKTSIEESQSSGLPIRLVQLPFPAEEAGVPEGCENLDTLPSKELIMNFFKATSLLRSAVEEYLSDLETPASCIISDMGLPWTSSTAKKLGIPRLVFHVTCCFSLLAMLMVRRSEVYETVSSDDEPFQVPGLRHKIEVTRAQLPSNIAMKSSMKNLRDEILESEAAASGVVVNSFDDLEQGYTDLYRDAIGKKVWTIGPGFYGNKAVHARGNRAAIEEDICSSWLDGRAPGSVIYASFGSMARLSFSQLAEIGLGLEASENPFIWVIRGADLTKRMEEWLNGGFEERNKGRGLVIRGWAPQVFILSHRSVGGFMTHCGWNSALEGISAGLPMITWPMFADQFFNEKVISEVAKIGVGLGVKSPSVWMDETPGVSVTKEDVEKAVKKLMDKGNEGEERRKRARDLGKRSRDAQEESGSSFANLTALIEQMTGR